MALSREILSSLGHQFGNAVHFAKIHAQNAAHIADDGLGTHGGKSDDLGDVVLAVLVNDVADDLVAAGVGKVDVDIGHAGPVRD